MPRPSLTPGMAPQIGPIQPNAIAPSATAPSPPCLSHPSPQCGALTPPPHHDPSLSPPHTPPPSPLDLPLACRCACTSHMLLLHVAASIACFIYITIVRRPCARRGSLCPHAQPTINCSCDGDDCGMGARTARCTALRDPRYTTPTADTSVSAAVLWCTQIMNRAAWHIVRERSELKHWGPEMLGGCRSTAPFTATYDLKHAPRMLLAHTLYALCLFRAVILVPHTQPGMCTHCTLA